MHVWVLIPALSGLLKKKKKKTKEDMKLGRRYIRKEGVQDWERGVVDMNIFHCEHV